MGRQYAQSCSLAQALDVVGERWSMLVVRELALGPMRFSELARGVGGAPTDVLTKRLRELERHGVLARRQLDPPAAGVAYELTELGHALEAPMLALARWGLRLQRVEDVVGLAPSSLPSALRVILRPPPRTRALVGLRGDGEDYTLRIEDGCVGATRGADPAAALILVGSPYEVLAALVVGGEAEERVGIEGDRALLAELRAMVAIPDRLREEAHEFVAQLSSVPS